MLDTTSGTGHGGETAVLPVISIPPDASPIPSTCAYTNRLTAMFTKDEYQSLASQFTFYVTLSTFSMALIFAFLTFLQGLGNLQIPKHNNFQLHIAMVTSFMATVLHFSIITVSGRATILCFRMAAIQNDVEGGFSSNIFPEYMKPLLKVDFTTYVTLCGNLLSLGTLCLIVGMLCVISYFMSPVALAIIGALMLCLLVTIIRMGFWEISGVREVWLYLFTLRTTSKAVVGQLDQHSSRFGSVVSLRESVGRIFRRRQNYTATQGTDVEQGSVAMASVENLKIS